MYIRFRYASQSSGSVIGDSSRSFRITVLTVTVVLDAYLAAFSWFIAFPCSPVVQRIARLRLGLLLVGFRIEVAPQLDLLAERNLEVT